MESENPPPLPPFNYHGYLPEGVHDTTVPELRDATADIFTGWLDGATAYFRARGLPEPMARDFAVVLIGALEGAFVLARTLRSTEPLLATGRVLAPQYRGVRLADAGFLQASAGGVSLPAPVPGDG